MPPKSHHAGARTGDNYRVDPYARRHRHQTGAEMISTGVMVQLGYVYGNLMVNVAPTNGKLVDQGATHHLLNHRISYDDSAVLLDRAGAVRTAVVMHKRGVSKAEAEQILKRAKGRLREALSEN